ncbi:hypothetical protein BSL78_24309 [Apostichopus japonicus]|uniref:Uncharacterized protein n=1 Tax=Stichopus japonicus TaxID=307972 RepID=A0A2G8JSY3_STIJA|nr:hypothetical protein BSL78_24309 [Apostichopus japonicus]
MTAGYRRQYSASTLNRIKSCITDNTIDSQLLNSLKDLGIVRRRRGKRAGIQSRISHTKSSNFSYPYGVSANINSIQGKFTHLEQFIVNHRNLCFVSLQETKIQRHEQVWLNDPPQHLMTDEIITPSAYCPNTRKHRKKVARDLNDANIYNLQSMLDSTVWAVVTETCSDLEEMTEVVSAYVIFVADVCIPKNSRPLVELIKRLPAANTIKQLEREKKIAIDNGSKVKRNKLQRDINRYIQKNRSDHFQEITSDSDALWRLLKTTRSSVTQGKLEISSEFGAELNEHFGRFNELANKDIVLLQRRVNIEHAYC